PKITLLRLLHFPQAPWIMSASVSSGRLLPSRTIHQHWASRALHTSPRYPRYRPWPSVVSSKKTSLICDPLEPLVPALSPRCVLPRIPGMSRAAWPNPGRNNENRENYINFSSHHRRSQRPCSCYLAD